ncbi:hypothetical protein COI97_16105 [Bacillus cereus]|nr:hypothetical protein COI97_16105 [Bacillus cereus]
MIIARLTMDLAKDRQQPVIRTRQNNDKWDIINVTLRDNDDFFFLKNIKLKFEGLKGDGSFVVDNDESHFRIVDPDNGIFEYTLMKEVIGNSGFMSFYFVIESGDKRSTTQTLRMEIGCDFKEGEKPSDNYISVFEQLEKDIRDQANKIEKDFSSTKTKVDQLLVAVSKGDFQIPKITNPDGSQTINATATDNVLDMIVAKGAGVNTIIAVTGAKGMPPANSTFRGISFFNDKDNGVVFVKDNLETLWTNRFSRSEGWKGWTKHASVDDKGNLINPNDTNWVTLNLTDGAQHIENRALKYRRIGRVVHIRGSVSNPPIRDGVSSFTTLPLGFRPDERVTIAGLVPGPDRNSSGTMEINVDANGNISSTGAKINSTVHINITYTV